MIILQLTLLLKLHQRARRRREAPEAQEPAQVHGQLSIHPGPEPEPEPEPNPEPNPEPAPEPNQLPGRHRARSQLRARTARRHLAPRPECCNRNGQPRAERSHGRRDGRIGLLSASNIVARRATVSVNIPQPFPGMMTYFAVGVRTGLQLDLGRLRGSTPTTEPRI